MGGSDEELIFAMARGKQAALGELYKRHASRLLIVVQSLLRDQALAADVVQEVFLEAWRKSADFNPARGTARAWLAVRARSRALDALRQKERRREASLSERPPPDSNSQAESDAVSLPSALGHVNEGEREVLQLGYFEDLSATEIAERLSIPVGTVKSRTRSGLKKLKAYWQEQQG